MAERRMFAKSIVLSDAFLDMPMSARCLYFTLGMLADDDGFVGNPKSIMRQCGASQDDMLILLQKRFVLGFESGVIVIKHWRMNNYLRSDRYNETTYLEEKEELSIDAKGSYTEKAKDGIPTGIPMVDTGKDSIGKSKDSINIERKKFTPPSLQEVEDYIKSRGNKISAKAFYDYYTAGDWKDSKGQPVKSWKQKAITWENKRNTNNVPDFESKKYDTKEKNMTQEEIDAFYKEIYG